MTIQRKTTVTDYVSKLPRLAPKHDGTVDLPVFDRLIKGVESLISRVNGLISFGSGGDGEWSGHIDGQWRVNIVTPAGANTLFQVEHGLGRIPVHFMYTCDRAAILYASETDRASWSNSRIYLKCNIISAKIYLIIV